jgi:hypothetical protein
MSGGAFIQTQSLQWDNAAMIMPAACSFDKLYVVALPTQAAPAAAVTLDIYLYKQVSGGSPVQQSVHVQVTTGTTQYVAVRGSDTAHLFSLSAGDEVAYGVSLSTTASPIPNVRFQVTSRCI